MSDTLALKQAKERIAELERLVGQKQIEIKYYKKMIDLAQDYYGIAIEKTFLCNPSSTSGSIEKNTPSV